MKNNHFTKHGIDHLSASTVNLWISTPAMCLMKLAGFSSHAGPAAWRGIGVDRAVTALIENPTMSLDSAQSIANMEFSQSQVKSDVRTTEDKITKERKHMKSCLDTAHKQIIPSYRERNLVESQKKIELMLDEIPVPFIGYIDLLFEDELVDLKSKSYNLSKPTLNDCRQMSIYAKATGAEPWLAYITHKEVRQFKVENLSAYLSDVIRAAQSLEKILSVSDDIEECCQFVYPDLDHWMWGDEVAVKEAKRIWRIQS